MQIRILEKKGNQRCLRQGVQGKARDSQGWSLAATLVMMSVITVFMAAMWTALIPAYMHVSSLRYKDTMRCVTEDATDSALAQMNAATSTITLPAVGSPLTLTPTEVQGATNYPTTTTITNLGSAPPTNCVFWSNLRPNTDNFYLVSTTVNKGGLTRTMSVLLSPIPAAGPVSPFKLGPAFGVSTITPTGLACINGYNLPAGWNNPYQFADITVAKGVAWPVGVVGDTSRSQIIAGDLHETWHSGDSPPKPPAGTEACVYEPFTQIMGNVYSNYVAQNGANGNGYWMRNQLSDISGGANVPNGSTANATVFGAANGLLLNGVGVPTGYQAGSSASSIPIPAYTSPTYTVTQPTNGSGSTVNPAWGFNANAGSTLGVMPQVGTSDGGKAFKATPYTGGYITSPGPGAAGAACTFTIPAPPVKLAPEPAVSIQVAKPATGGLGVPDTGATNFVSSPISATINGGTLNITNSVTTFPTSLNVGSGQTVNIPPGNYNLSSLQVINGGKITIDSAIQGQTQFFITNTNNSSTTTLYVDNTSSINMTGISGTGFTTGGQKGFGNSLPADQPTVDTVNTIKETSGSCLNLLINSNSNTNMNILGNVRALINAPNANVIIGCSSASSYMANNANVYGSVIGNNVFVQSAYAYPCGYGSYGAGYNGGAYLHYDVKLKQMDQAPGSGVPATFGNPLAWYDPWMFAATSGSGSAATTWRACSWQEQLGAW